MFDAVGNDFVWFFGVIEDIDDPLKLGRARVRIFSWHTDQKNEIPTTDLPWAQPIQSVQSAAMGDVGHSPTGYVNGTWVVGFFIDGKEAQRPVIMGTLSGIPTQSADPTKGFNDPDAVYPKRTHEPDVNRLARNDTGYEHPVIAKKNSSRITNIPIAGGGTWDEPETSYNAEYPKNQVFESESGHIREYDDTGGAERIHEYHKEGTFYEIHPQGDKQTRIVGDNYTVIAGTDYCRVEGDCNLYVGEDGNVIIAGNQNIQVGGNQTENIGGSSTKAVSGSKVEGINGSETETVGKSSTKIVQNTLTEKGVNRVNILSDVRINIIAPDVNIVES